MRIKLQGSHAPWKSLEIVVGAGILVLTLSNPANAGKPSLQNCSCCGRTKKDIDSRLFFALNGVLEKMGNVPLKVLEKPLNFLFKKRVQNLRLVSRMSLV